MEQKIKDLQKQINYLRFVIAFMFLLCFFFIALVGSSDNHKMDAVSNGMIVNGDTLVNRIEFLKLHQSNDEINIKTLFRNDSIIVANQKRIQQGQKINSFFSFMGKMLL